MVTLETTVPFQDPQGNSVSYGLLTLDLSQPALVTSGGGLVAPSRVSIDLDTDGLLPSGVTAYANSELTPDGTTYHAVLYNSTGSVIADFGEWAIIGTTPIDLSQMVPTTTGASYPSAGLLDVDNTWTADNTFEGTVQVGASGTAISQIRVYTPTLTPSSVNTSTSAEQTFSVSGLATSDKVLVNGPAPTAGTGIGGARVSATDTLAITFVNAATSSKTPASGTYAIVAIRS